MKRLISQILIIVILAATSVTSVIAQKKNTSRIKMGYFNDYDKKERVEVILKVKVKKYLPLSNAELQFYFVNDTSKVLLENVFTDDDGKAIFDYMENPAIVKDSSGILTFEVEYGGNDTIKSDKRDISIKQGDLEISFSQKDSLKTIHVYASQFSFDDQKTSIEGVKIEFFVKGTFSLLRFGKEKTNNEGIAEIEFPTDMPGDTAGVLTVVVKIDDKKFGIIEREGKINWGIPIQPVMEKQRGLGDTDAPLWMVYTLITLLSVVWIHYLYVIFLIFKIRRSK